MPLPLKQLPNVRILGLLLQHFPIPCLPLVLPVTPWPRHTKEPLIPTLTGCQFLFHITFLSLFLYHPLFIPATIDWSKWFRFFLQLEAGNLLFLQVEAVSLKPRHLVGDVWGYAPFISEIFSYDWLHLLRDWILFWNIANFHMMTLSHYGLITCDGRTILRTMPVVRRLSLRRVWIGICAILCCLSSFTRLYLEFFPASNRSPC